MTKDKLLRLAKSFLGSEIFDVTLFWFAALILISGVGVRFGAGPAMMTGGAVLLLSVKPLLRWIR